MQVDDKPEPISETIRQNRSAMLDALLKGDRRAASAIASKYSKSHETIKELYEEVIKPSLYKVGELWEYNLITVAAEHLATSITEAVMNELYENVISEERSNNKVVLGCVESEYHQVGIKMIADVLEMHGIDTYFLGANVPVSDFIAYVQEVRPGFIAISLSVSLHFKELERMLGAIREIDPDILIIVGGQAFLHGGDYIESKYNRLKIVHNIEELENCIEQNKCK